MKYFGKYNSLEEMYSKESPKELNKLFKHGKPLNRRDLLRAGALQFAATMTLPTIWQTLVNTGVAEAAACGASTSSQVPTFVGLNLRGGYASLGNALALGQDGDYIPDYGILGHGTRAEAVTNTVSFLNGAKFAVFSQIMAGIQVKASAATLANTTMVVIPVQSQNDSGDNKFDISGLLYKMGLKGGFLPNLGSLGNSAIGMNQMPALVPPPTALAVTNTTQIANAIGVNGSIGAVLDSSEKGSLFSLIADLTAKRAPALAGLSGGDVMSKLVTEATAGNVPLVSSSNNGVDPLSDPALSARFNTIWGIGNNTLQQNTNTASMQRVFSSMVYNGLKGNAGTVNLEMGGYDYHGDTRAQADTKDLNAGTVIGQILESAAAAGKKLFLYVCSDGAVGAPTGSAAGDDFVSDRGEGAIYCIAYCPTAAPLAVDKTGAASNQVGYLTNAQAAATTTLTGGNAEMAALAAFANYCSFNGNMEAFYTAAGRVWSDAELAEVVRIRPCA